MQTASADPKTSLSARASALLSAALRDHAIECKKEVIVNELDETSQQGRANAQWVLEHVSPDTLLSNDETVIAKSLERAGMLEPLLRHTELESTRIFSEDEIREATALLRSSSTVYADQVSALKRQVRIFENIQTASQTTERDRGLYLKSLNDQHVREGQRIKAMADELESDLEIKIREYEQQNHADRKSLLYEVGSKLAQDDAALANGQRLMVEVDSTEADERMEKRTSHLITLLSNLIADEIRCRLDRLYLQALLSHDTGATDGMEVEQISTDEIEADLESLYSEIDVLAEISARQKFGQPILLELRRRKQHVAHSTEENLSTVEQALQQMTRSNEDVTTTIRHHQSHCETLKQLSALFREEVSTYESETAVKKTHDRAPSLSSPVKPSQSQSPQSLESFLRRLGIDPSTQNTTELVSEKRSELVNLLHHDLGVAAEKPLHEPLGLIAEATALLTSVLQADSNGELSLVNASEKERLDELESELSSLQRDIEKLDLSMLTQPYRSRDKFVEKWGSS